MGAIALALGIAVTMTPAGALAPAGEAHAATTSALEGSAATAASNRVSESLPLSKGLKASTERISEDALLYSNENASIETYDGSTEWRFRGEIYNRDDYRYMDLGGSTGAVGLIAGNPSRYTMQALRIEDPELRNTTEEEFQATVRDWDINCDWNCALEDSDNFIQTPDGAMTIWPRGALDEGWRPNGPVYIQVWTNKLIYFYGIKAGEREGTGTPYYVWHKVGVRFTPTDGQDPVNTFFCQGYTYLPGSWIHYNVNFTEGYDNLIAPASGHWWEFNLASNTTTEKYTVTNLNGTAGVYYFDEETSTISSLLEAPAMIRTGKSIKLSAATYSYNMDTESLSEIRQDICRFQISEDYYTFKSANFTSVYAPHPVTDLEDGVSTTTWIPSGTVRCTCDPNPISIAYVGAGTYYTMPEDAMTSFNVETACALPVPSVPKVGYTFAGWYKTYNTDTGEYSDELSEIAEGTKEALTLYPKWTENKLSLTYYATEDEVLEVEDAEYSGKDGYSNQAVINARIPNQNSYNQSDNGITLTGEKSKVLDPVAFTCEGHDFAGWKWKIPGKDISTETVSDSDANLITTLLEDATNYTADDRSVNLYATWKLSTYTVNFEGDGIDVNIADGKKGKFAPAYGEWVVDPADSNKWTALGQTWTANGDDTFTATFNYRTGLTFPNETNSYKTGYSFNKWHLSTDTGLVAVDSIAIGDTSKNGKAYTANFTPKKYKVNYKLSGNTADKTYGAVVTGASQNGGVKVDGSGNECSTSFDFTSIAAAGGAKLAPASGNKGYKYVGWAKSDSAPGDTQGNAAKFSAVTTGGDPDIRLLLWPSDDGLDAKSGNYDLAAANSTNERTVNVYAVWQSDGTVGLTLGNEEPSGILVPGGTSTQDGVAVSGDANTVYWWPAHGITKDSSGLVEGTSAAYKSGDVSADALGIAVPTRTGYDFKGWGKPAATADVADQTGSGADTIKEHPLDDSDDCFDHDGDGDEFVLYMSYGDGKLKVTDTGAKVIQSWEDAPSPAIGLQNWVAVWQAKPYTATLRIPTHALAAVDGRYDQTTWSDERVDDASGWLNAAIDLHYWDEIWVPYYQPNNNSFTFNGWYTDRNTDEGSRVGEGAPSEKGARGSRIVKGMADAADGFQWYAASGETQTLRVNGASAVEGRDTSSRDKDLWLGYTTVKIGVTAPMFAYLCEDKYEAGDTIPPDKAVGDYTEDPYVVGGSDTRTMLESRISFETNATTSHDFVITDVECIGSGSDSDGKLWASDMMSEKDERYFYIAPEPTVRNSKTGNSWTTTELAAADSRYYFGTVEDVLDDDGVVAKQGNNKLTQAVDENGNDDPNKADASKGIVDFSRYIVGQPGSRAYDKDGNLAYKESADGTYTDTITTDNPAKYRKTTLYYGLDLNKTAILKKAAQEAVAAATAAAKEATTAGNEEAVSDTVQRVRLARLIFTFAPKAH